MTGSGKAIAVVGLGLLGSQAGHLLAYQLRFSASAFQLQTTGAHSYFPLLAKTTLGAAAAALLSALLLVGLARVLLGRQAKSVARPSYVGLLARLFTIQLAVFMVQEIAEALIAGTSAGSAPQLLLWGTLGQLPIAAVAALALRWLSARVETAVGAIRDVVAASTPIWMSTVPVAIPAYAALDRALLMSLVAGRSLARRGPPRSLPIRTY